MAVQAESSVQDSKWKKGDGEALATIVLACKSTKQAWAALKERHDNLSIPASSSVATVKEWCTMTLKSGENIEKFFHEWELVATKLEPINFVFKARFKIFLLLSSLPVQYCDDQCFRITQLYSDLGR